MRQLMTTLLMTLMTVPTLAASLEQRIAVENDYRNRVKNVIEKVDPSAIVQVSVVLKKVVADSLPGMGFGAEITPMDLSGQLNKASIEKVSIRIATQIEEVPEWIKEEVNLAIGNDIKTDIKITKAKGIIKDTNTELTQFAMAATQSAVEGLSSLKYGLWSLAGGLVFLLGVIGLILSRFAARLEKSMSKVIEEKVVPAMQTGSRGGNVTVASAEPKEAKPMSINMTGGGGTGGQKELAELPQEALLSLFSDCYWTQSDSYAHYLWTQLSQEQRKNILAADTLDKKYFSYFLQFAPENMNYHFDVRYLMLGRDFESVDQSDLSKWVQAHPKSFRRITPLRWDLLPLNLENRLKFMEMPDEASSAPAKIAKASAKRVLKDKIQIKKLTPADENFVWENPGKVPADARKELASLVWLGLCEEPAIQTILGDLDARQLASAWVGPEAVLEKLKNTLAPKKREMLEHFLKESAPSRASEAFTYMVQAGIDALEKAQSNEAPEQKVA